MNTPKLPPLPDPKYIWHDADEPGEADLFEFEFAGAVDGRCDTCERLYTAEQMQAYAIAAIEAQGVPEEGADSVCDVPPIGWRCTRSKGHVGPCAAVECREEVEFIEKGMERLRETPTQDASAPPAPQSEDNDATES